jgi:hypothetical protein
MSETTPRAIPKASQELLEIERRKFKKSARSETAPSIQLQNQNEVVQGQG